MARLPRLSLPGIPQHVLQRGHNGRPSFFCSDDYGLYLEYLSDAAEKYEVSIHAYCLMPNHVHLLMTPASKSGISRVLQDLGRRYVRQINDQYQRRGTLWEGRYHACLIEDSAYLLRTYRYIERNPLRAGLVDQVADYPWSSYHTNARGRPNYLITPHDHYLKLARAPADRCYVYGRFLGTAESGAFLRMIREATQSNRVLGGDQFLYEVEAELSVQLRKKRAGRPRIAAA